MAAGLTKTSGLWSLRDLGWVMGSEARRSGDGLVRDAPATVRQRCPDPGGLNLATTDTYDAHRRTLTTKSPPLNRTTTFT